MPKTVAEIIAGIDDFKKLKRLEKNIMKQNAMTAEIEAALLAKETALGRSSMAARTGLNLDNLSLVEERILGAALRYVEIQRRVGKTAPRTVKMLANRGLIGAAEAAVCRSKPTQGFEVLEDADLKPLSFEQIIVDFPDEFSDRAMWFARKTLSLPNESEKPPASNRLTVAFASVPTEAIAPVPVIPAAFASEIAKIADLERKAINDTPEERLKTGLVIERGLMGRAVKEANGYKCQICEAMGLHPYAFIKPNGVPYVEAHHVTPVSERQIGSLAASNILTVCANHHRQMHFGNVKVDIPETEFVIVIDEQAITIRRFSAV